MADLLKRILSILIRRAKRFATFDILLGVRLVKAVYFFGLLLIAGSTLIATYAALKIMPYTFTTGLQALIYAGFAAVFLVLIWRLICELSIHIFRIGADVSEIRRQGENAD